MFFKKYGGQVIVYSFLCIQQNHVKIHTYIYIYLSIYQKMKNVISYGVSKLPFMSQHSHKEVFRIFKDISVVFTI